VASEVSVLPARRPGVYPWDVSRWDFSRLSQALGALCVQCLGLVQLVRSSLRIVCVHVWWCACGVCSV
jgi:hypothetical protein